MTLGEIIFKFRNNIKIVLRQLDKLERKQVKANMAILFNRTCINIYIYIYIYNIKIELIIEINVINKVKSNV